MLLADFQVAFPSPFTNGKIKWISVGMLKVCEVCMREWEWTSGRDLRECRKLLRNMIY